MSFEIGLSIIITYFYVFELNNIDIIRMIIDINLPFLAILTELTHFSWIYPLILMFMSRIWLKLTNTNLVIILIILILIEYLLTVLIIHRFFFNIELFTECIVDIKNSSVKSNKHNSILTDWKSFEPWIRFYPFSFTDGSVVYSLIFVQIDKRVNIVEKNVFHHLKWYS